MKRSLILVISMAWLAVSLAGCGGATQDSYTANDMAAPPRPAQAMPTMVPEPATIAQAREAGSAQAPELPEQQAPIERKIVYRADMSVVVKDTEEAMQQIEELVEARGGYVASSQLNQYHDDLLQGSLTVRVPAESFQSVMAQVRALALRVQYENSNAEDVTAEYTDLQARLRNLEAAEQELLALLTEVRERPNATAEDILDVFNALSEKRGEIEQVKGRMQYLDNLTAFSTITIQLTPDQLSKPVIDEDWQPLVTVKDAFRTLVNILQGLVDLLIGFVIVVLPVVVILLVPLVAFIFLVRWLVQRRQRRK